MTIASKKTFSKEAPFDLRPSAVLAIGVVGIHSAPTSHLASEQYTSEVKHLLCRLSESVQAVMKSRPTLFAATRPKLRCVSMLSEGAALEAAKVALVIGADLSCVLPFDASEYRRSFGEHDRAAVEKLIGASSSCLTLPGTPDENDKAYARAYSAIASNVDILLVISNERLSENSGDLKGLFQTALSCGIPIISMDTENSRPALLLTRPAHDELAGIIADLKEQELPADLEPLVRSVLLPPRHSAVQRSLQDLVAESEHLFPFRFEYSMLLQLFRVWRVPGREHRQRSSVEPTHLITLTDNRDFMRRLQCFDQLANYYSQLSRSSATTGFLVIILVAFLSALAGMVFPSLSGVSIAIQVSINILVLFDVALMKRHRWMERWLDYRAIAERLRCLQFLHPLGLGDVHRSNLLNRRRQSWIDWYVRRCCFGLDAPSGQIRRQDISSIADNLIVKAINVQLNYHRRSFRRFGRLEHRLHVAAYVALATTVAIAAAIGIAAQFVGGIQGVSWRPFAMLALAVLPAISASFNGVRADADLVQLVERSALTIMALTRLRQAIRRTTLSYDRMAAAASKVSLLMGDELSEWRFMLENRRLRQSRSSEWRSR